MHRVHLLTRVIEYAHLREGGVRVAGQPKSDFVRRFVHGATDRRQRVIQERVRARADELPRPMKISKTNFSMSIPEYRTADCLWEQVVQLGGHSRARLPLALLTGIIASNASWMFWPHPNDPGIDGARRAAPHPDRAPLTLIRQPESSGWFQPTFITNDCTGRLYWTESPFETLWVPLDVEVSFVGGAWWCCFAMGCPRRRPVAANGRRNFMSVVECRRIPFRRTPRASPC